jgi:hypothetical protein
MTFEPILLLSMWAAGLAFVAAIVAWWNIVGRGYLWLTGATAAVIGLAAAFDSTQGIVAVVLTLAATAVAGRRVAATALFALGGLAFLWVAADIDGWIGAIAGAVALGGVTGEGTSPSNTIRRRCFRQSAGNRASSCDLGLRT